MLLKQSTSEIDTIVKVFYLTRGEKEFLLSAGVGEGLFFAGLNHVTMKIVSAPFEHTVITSNPQELTQQQQKTSSDQQSPDTQAFGRKQPTTLPISNLEKIGNT